MAKFGYDGTPYSKVEYEAYKGKKKRTDAHETDYLKHNDIINKDNDPHLNVSFGREHHGGLEVLATGSPKNRPFYEKWSHAEGTQVLPDGTVCKRCGATVNEYSGSKISTNIGPSDQIKSGNHSVSRVGNLDNKDYAAAGAPERSGSSYTENGNNWDLFNAGMNLIVSGRSKYGGMAATGSGGHVQDAQGKADQGYGTSVSNGDDWVSTIRQMGNGDTFVQVGKVNGDSANYVLKIDYQGNMTITTKGSITVQSEGTHTIKAPKIELDTPLVHTTGEIVSDDDHTAPNFHGCADRAKGPC